VKNEKDVEIDNFDETEDVERLISWIDSARLNRVWASNKFAFPLSAAELTAHFLTAKNNNIVVFKIVDKLKQKVVGHCELEVYSNAVKISRFLIAEKYRGQGYGQDTLKKLLQYISKNFNVSTVFLTVFSFNPAIRLYEKMGFEKTGIEKNFLQFENELWHRVTMKLNKKH
jgi:RimJ/RimL family protein N-acetyltransferase